MIRTSTKSYYASLEPKVEESTLDLLTGGVLLSLAVLVFGLFVNIL